MLFYAWRPVRLKKPGTFRNSKRFFCTFWHFFADVANLRKILVTFSVSYHEINSSGRQTNNEPSESCRNGPMDPVRNSGREGYCTAWRGAPLSSGLLVYGILKLLEFFPISATGSGESVRRKCRGIRSSAVFLDPRERSHPIPSPRPRERFKGTVKSDRMSTSFSLGATVLSSPP